MQRAPKINLLWRVYIATFFYALQYAVVLYSLSTYISDRVGEANLGLVYSAVAVISILISYNFAWLERRLGVRLVTLICIAITLLCLALLATITAISITIVAVIAYLAFEFILLICFDLYIETLSKDALTGNIRGINLTMQSMAFVFGPMIMGLVVVEGNYGPMFLTSALLMLPIAFIYISSLHTVKTVAPRPGRVIDAIKTLGKNQDLRTIFFSGCALELFYNWMTIYTPIYLYAHMGFSVSDTAIIFPIMLMPFVLFQLPLGILSDRYWGEKEILIAGYVIAGVSTAGLYFLQTPNVLLWALMLFLTRTGASMIEVMNETYFFKKVGAKDASVIMLFRNARQYNNIIGPLVAGLVLIFLPFKMLFIILGLGMFGMSLYLGRLRDTN